jgi:hypothetical protein
VKSIVIRRAFLAVGLAFGLALGVVPALGQAPDKPLAVPFRPDSGSTIAYQVTEAEASSGPQGPLYQRWHYTLTLALGEPEGERWPAMLTISDVTVQDGKDFPLHLILARIAEGLPVAVRLDRRGGFVHEVVEWPAVKAKLKRALADRIPREDGPHVQEVLDRSDATQGSGVIGRALTLISGGYAMGIRPDGAPVTSQNWMGGSAYILPAGRTLTSHFAGYDQAKGLVAVDWSIATDPAVAARHLGPELLSLLPDGSGRDVARARGELERALAGGVTLKESGQVIHSRQRRIVASYTSTLEIEMGPFRKERGILAELIPP